MTSFCYKIIYTTKALNTIRLSFSILIRVSLIGRSSERNIIGVGIGVESALSSSSGTPFKHA